MILLYSFLFFFALFRRNFSSHNLIPGGQISVSFEDYRNKEEISLKEGKRKKKYTKKKWKLINVSFLVFKNVHLLVEETHSK